MEHHHNQETAHNFNRKIEFLDSLERIKAFPPMEFLKLLPMKQTDHILDLGAGTGYLSIPAAQMTEGTIYALDMDPHMLEVIATKAKDHNIANIKLVEGSIDNIPLTDESVDIILASLVLHEVKPLSLALEQMKRVLKTDGHILCFEYEKNENANAVDGPPMKVRIPSSTMEEELMNAGFHITQKLTKDFAYIIIAKK